MKTLLILTILLSGCAGIPSSILGPVVNVKAYTVPPTYTEEHKDFNVFLYNNALQANIRF